MSTEIKEQVEDKLAEQGVVFKVRYIGESKADDWRYDGWGVELQRSGRPSFSTVYKTGLGHRRREKPVPPHAAGVLACLLLDAEAADYNFQDWCDTFGYSSDSLKALNMYNACLDTARQLRALFSYTIMQELKELLKDY